MTRTGFLREQTIQSKNKVARTIMPPEWSTAELACGLCERKARGLKMMLENMPLYIGEQELIVGTRTLYGKPAEEKGEYTVCDFNLSAYPKYINQSDIEYFGFNEENYNNRHFTPDFSVILNYGIDGIIKKAANKLTDSGLTDDKIDYLKGTIAAYEGLSVLIERHSVYAFELAGREGDKARKAELEKIGEVCKNIAHNRPDDFYEAIQLMWFTHLTTMIESFMFINFGRLDVIFYPFLSDTPHEQAQQLIECLLLKMYDQTDINESYLGKASSQLNLTIGGVDKNGEDAVNPVTFMILNGLEKTAMPEPQIAIRINSRNPSEMLKRACELTVKGLNIIAYYNDDLFIDSMIRVGIEPKDARLYAFDLCQDINIPGRGDFYRSGSINLAETLMEYLNKVDDNIGYKVFISGYKKLISERIKIIIERYNETHKAFLEYSEGNHKYYFDNLREGKIDRNLSWNSLMCPLPFISALYHNCIETATDLTYQNLPIKDIGFFVGVATEAVNSLAAIKKYVFDTKEYKLSYINKACKENYNTLEYEILRSKLWNAPKWGNDDDYVDLIAKNILEFSCNEILKYKTITGGRHLAGIHQPHPIPSGANLMATPEGRKKGTPVAVTLTPESGTIKNGPSAALKSAAKFDYKNCQWNFCVMLSYYASTFRGNDGAQIFETLIKSYFGLGGLQHQPNVADVEDLKAAQLNPGKYKDLIVRLWGVSAHFVDLPKELQDELISRFQ